MFRQESTPGMKHQWILFQIYLPYCCLLNPFLIYTYLFILLHVLFLQFIHVLIINSLAGIPVFFQALTVSISESKSYPLKAFPPDPCTRNHFLEVPLAAFPFCPALSSAFQLHGHLIFHQISSVQLHTACRHPQYL